MNTSPMRSLVFSRKKEKIRTQESPTNPHFSHQSKSPNHTTRPLCLAHNGSKQIANREFALSALKKIKKRPHTITENQNRDGRPLISSLFSQTRRHFDGCDGNVTHDSRGFRLCTPFEWRTTNSEGRSRSRIRKRAQQMYLRSAGSVRSDSFALP